MVKRKAKAKRKKMIVRKVRSAKKSKKAKASRPGYDIHTGKPTGRDASAMQRLEKLTEKYVAEGMSLAEARQKAKAEMRANPRMDWRL
jgi:hypothetical protein